MLLTLLALLARPASAAISLADAQAILLIESRRLPPVALADYLEHEDAETRARAARALGRLRDGAAVVGLRRLASDPAVEVRREVAFALGQTPGSTALVVTQLAEERDPVARALLVEALGKVGDAQVLPMLMEALTTRGQGLRPSLEPAAAARALGRLAMREVDGVATPLVAERLLVQLGRFDRDTRRAAAFALGRLGLTTLSSPTRDRLLAAATEDHDPVVRAFLVRAAGRLDLDAAEQDAVLGRAALDPAPGVRTATARAAARLGWAGVVPLLEDEDRGVRREAIAAVAKLDDPDPVALLQPLIDLGASLDAAETQRMSGDARLVEAAAAISGLGARGLLPDLERYLDLAMPTRVRTAAVRGLGSVPRLVELATGDAERPVRSAAATRLTEVSTDPTEVLPLLDAFDPIVAAIAAEHLAANPTPRVEDRLVGALVETEDPDLLRAAAEALAVRFQGHPNPPLRKNEALLQTLATLAGHPDSSVRAAAAKLAETLGVESESSVHSVVNVPLDEVMRVRSARIMTSRGEVRVDLLPEEAPLTVWNFAGLAEQGYFDNLVLHRVVPDFVVQDGDPRGDGYGGPGWTIPDEINPVRYDAGVLGMALAGPDTGGSQWFVTLSPQPHLDGGYTAFGRVTHGMGLLRTLQPGDRIEDVIIERAPAPEADGS